MSSLCHLCSRLRLFDMATDTGTSAAQVQLRYQKVELEISQIPLSDIWNSFLLQNIWNWNFEHMKFAFQEFEIDADDIN